jgi:Glycosyl hydrolase family 12/Carbohydrate binding domain
MPFSLDDSRLCANDQGLVRVAGEGGAQGDFLRPSRPSMKTPVCVHQTKSYIEHLGGNRMADGNLVKNGDFSADPTDIDPWSTDKLTAVPRNGNLLVNITEPGRDFSDASVAQDDIELATGSMYVLSFAVSADRPTRMLVSLQNADNFDAAYYSSEIDVTTNTRKFRAEFSVPATDKNASLQFQVGGHGQAEITLGPVALEFQRAIGPGEEERFQGHLTQFVKGPYRYLNNAWGRQKLPSNTTYVQYLRRRVSNGGETLGWFWSWPDIKDETIYSYPEIVFGLKPGDEKSTTPLLPKRLSQLRSAELTYDITLSVESSAYNLAPEIWITDKATEGNVIAEIMIWLDYDGLEPAGRGNEPKRAVIGGKDYDVFFDQMPDPDFREAWSGSDVKLMASLKDLNEIPNLGKNLIIIAQVSNVLHFRAFDREGNRAHEADEMHLPQPVPQLEGYKQKLANLWPPHQVSDEEKKQIIIAFGSIFARRWNYIAYRALQKGVMKGSLPILEFLKDAMSRKDSMGREYPKDDQFVASIEFGNEIGSGKGSVWVHEFNVDVS